MFAALYRLAEPQGPSFYAGRINQIELLAGCGRSVGDRTLLQIQEEKLRRAQGLETPPWTKEDEKRYMTEFAKVSIEGICLAAVKP